jgi:hypothetical protein
MFKRVRFIAGVLTAVLASGCGPAEFGSIGASGANEDCECQNSHPVEVGSSPTPSPTPSATSKPPCPRSTPRPGACTLKVWVKVQSFEIKWDHNRFTAEPTSPAEIDLCELSKDFFGVIERNLNVKFPEGRRFSGARFILQSIDGHRVEDANGARICSLRLPPSMTAGLRFETDREGQIVLRTPEVGFDFDEDDALHRLGIGSCQLKHPVGHYDLKVLGLL